MKKLLILLIVFIFAVSASFAQAYVVSVDWDEDECSCLDQGNSYYGVKVVIYDEANDIVVIEGKQVNVDFGTYAVDVSVPEVNGHCEDQSLPLSPSYKVWVGVTVFCDSQNPPVDLCTTGDYLFSPNANCTTFANGNVDFENLLFE
jgi:hypothetical protein